MTALSIRAAAREAADRPAIITPTATWTFRQCADAIANARLEASLVADPTVETILAIHAALEAHHPLALHHARLTAADRARQDAQLATASFAPDDAFVLFTSGSTGPSRGVVLGRDALVAAADASAAHLGWRDDDRWLLCLSVAHAGGLSIVVRCLAARRPIVLFDDHFAAPPVAALLEHATTASLVPAQLSALLEDPAWRAPRALRAVLLGGAAAPPSLLAAARGRGVPVRVTYGLTETFGQVATARADDPRLHPLPGVALAAGTRTAPAAIRIRGAMLATRYLDGTPIAPELVTADLGFVDHGVLHVVGRADDVIVTGGENVHPAQVEAVLAATPGVRAACAFGLADPRWGQIVGAAIATDPAFDPAAAAAHWHAALPAYARPRRLAIAALPLLPSGKIDRRAAAALPTVPVAY